jgi:YesN/AraC family two-component response regulator
MTAENGQRALKLLETKKVDLVITDLMMPFIDGFELLERFKNDENLSKIPILVLSARTSEEDKEKVLSKGVNDFLCKPFNTKELLTRINNLLTKKTKWNKENHQAISLNDTHLLVELEKNLLEKVERKIIANIDDPNLSVKDLADEIAVSERKFYRLIKKLTNITPFEYIKEVRLQYVKKLLTEKKLSNSSEAAKLIGMNNVSHFNVQFKKRFGKKLSDILH